METLTEPHSIYVLGVLSCRWLLRLKYIWSERAFVDILSKGVTNIVRFSHCQEIPQNNGSMTRGAALKSGISSIEKERRNVRVIVRPVNMTLSETSIEKGDYLRLLVWDQLQTEKESNWGTKKRRLNVKPIMTEMRISQKMTLVCDEDGRLTAIDWQSLA